MPVVAFDTLAYSSKLQESGMPREQAEAIARANVDAFRSLVVTQQLATKDEIADLRQEILTNRWELEKIIDNGNKKNDTNQIALDNKIDNGFNELDKKIDNVYNVLDKKIDSFRSELEKKIDGATHTMLKWLIGLIVGLGAVLMTFIVYMK